ncbi:hypothetical protein RCL1_006843 [Eukaryota sp. TZLM3-RCL]
MSDLKAFLLHQTGLPNDFLLTVRDIRNCFGKTFVELSDSFYSVSAFIPSNVTFSVSEKFPVSFSLTESLNCIVHIKKAVPVFSLHEPYLLVLSLHVVERAPHSNDNDIIPLSRTSDFQFITSSLSQFSGYVGMFSTQFADFEAIKMTKKQITNFSSMLPEFTDIQEKLEDLFHPKKPLSQESIDLIHQLMTCNQNKDEKEIQIEQQPWLDTNPDQQTSPNIRIKQEQKDVDIEIRSRRTVEATSLVKRKRKR